jgi:hypothetical protein
MLFLATYPFSAELEPPMSVLQFVDSMVGRLAWPLVVLFLAFMLRKQLAALAERVLELSFGGATVKFGDLLTKGTDIVDAAPEVSAKAVEQAKALTEHLSRIEDGHETEVLQSFEEIESNMEQLLRGRAIAHIHDTSVRKVFGAFEEMEAMLNQVGAALKADLKGTMLMRNLYRRGLLPNDLTELYKNLRRARNAIAHGEANLPNEAEALEYDRQANYVLAQLRNALHTALHTLQANGKKEDPSE